jgi:branched-chain amino acid transport system permease protein
VEQELQLALSGLLAGFTYALVAVGLTLVFGIMRVVNLSHGAFFALGAFVTYGVVQWGGGSFLALPVVFLLSLLLGMGLERWVLRPVRRHHAVVAIVTLAVAIFMEQVFQLVWGPDYHSIPRELPLVRFMGTAVDLQQIVAALVAVALLLVLFGLLRTKIGMAVRLVAQDAEGAALVGIDVPRVQTVVFGVACGLAAVAGNLTAFAHSIYPAMGRVPLVMSLAVVIFGGLGNVHAALVAGLILGLVASGVSFYVSPEWSYVTMLLVIAVGLLTRPSGLLGRVGRRD